MASPPLLVAALVFVVPVGLLLVWWKSPWSTRTRAWVTAAAAVWAMLLVTAVGGGSTAPASRGTVPQAAATATTIATASATPSGTTTPSAAPSPSARPRSADEVIRAAAPGTALAVLGTLAVKGRAAKTGYERDVFGPAWSDTDRNGCDTRNDILRRDLVDEVIKPGTHGCVVLSGDAAPEPYTGRDVHFERGGVSEIEIDHVVALSDAWQKGAATWEFGKRLAFANDPLELLAVDGPANRQKGDGDAATWLPSNKAYRCAYVARQVAVKAKYRLWVTSAERDAIARVLTSCPGERAPTGAAPTLAPVAGTAAPRPATTTAAPAPVTTSAPTTSYVQGVHPGAFCSQHGAYGYTSAGTLMQCKTSPTDSRYRWRAA